MPSLFYNVVYKWSSYGIFEFVFFGYPEVSLHLQAAPAGAPCWKPFWSVGIFWEYLAFLISLTEVPFTSVPSQYAFPHLTTAPLNIRSIILFDKAGNKENMKKIKLQVTGTTTISCFCWTPTKPFPIAKRKLYLHCLSGHFTDPCLAAFHKNHRFSQYVCLCILPNNIILHNYGNCIWSGLLDIGSITPTLL